jgi:HD-GYP domain-containing protein (c-di-GMP phosphodiesterase class II)
MELCPLAKLQHRIRLGLPLPFSIRDHTNRLLLEKHQVVADEGQLVALIDGGATVDLDELRGHARGVVAATPPEALPALWRKLGDQLSRVLGGMPSPQAPDALDETARYLAALVDRAPELALFALVRAEHSDQTRYGALRSLQAATAGYLVGARLQWPAERLATLVKAAFTMNLGMLDLQERLSTQTRPLSPSQRASIQAHPVMSAATLRDSGVVDAEWLLAVTQHHERPGGRGYPAGSPEVSEMARLLSVVDDYTAKLAARATRSVLAPAAAAQQLAAQEPDNVFAQALVAELGPWPPGALVRLESGETGVVVARGADPLSPAVALLSDPMGVALPSPVRREAGHAGVRIAGSAPARGLRLRIRAEQLFGAAPVS